MVKISIIDSKLETTCISLPLMVSVTWLLAKSFAFFWPRCHARQDKIVIWKNSPTTNLVRIIKNHFNPGCIFLDMSSGILNNFWNSIEIFYHVFCDRLVFKLFIQGNINRNWKRSKIKVIGQLQKPEFPFILLVTF